LPHRKVVPHLPSEESQRLQTDRIGRELNAEGDLSYRRPLEGNEVVLG
jgi:hypothetical protein